MDTIWSRHSSHTNCLFHNLQEVYAALKKTTPTSYLIGHVYYQYLYQNPFKRRKYPHEFQICKRVGSSNKEKFKDIGKRQYLVVIASVVVATISCPMLSNNFFHCNQLVPTSLLVPVSQNREPCQDCPDTILLSDMVRTCKRTKEIQITHFKKLDKEKGIEPNISYQDQSPF